MRVAVITNHPAPYRQPLFDALAGRLDELIVIYEGRESVARGWGAATSSGHQQLFAADEPIESIGAREKFRNARRALSGVRPDVVVFPGFGPAAEAAARSPRRAALIGWSGATARADRRVRGLRLTLRRRLARRAAAWIAYGPEARRYLIALGAGADRVVAAGNPYGIPSRPPRSAPEQPLRIGFAGSLHWRKGWWVPVQALRAASEAGVEAHLKLVADGSGRALLERLLAEGDAERTDWQRHVVPAEMPSFYDGIDLLLVPSFVDQWPIVASEATARGVPVLASPEHRSGLPPEVTTLRDEEGPEPGAILEYADAIRETAGSYPEGTQERVRTAQGSISPGAVADRWLAAIEAGIGR